MNCFSSCRNHKRLVFLRRLLLMTAILSFFAAATGLLAQGTNNTGNGGRNIIQGRIYLPSGQRSSNTFLKIRLESMGLGDLTVFADANGSFAFKNLTAGSYYVVIQDDKDFEDFREGVYIDDPGSSSIRGGIAPASTPRTSSVQIFLQPRRMSGAPDSPPGVISAELAKAPPAAVDSYNKALAYAREGKNELAIAELNKALALFPEFPPALNELGILYGRTGQRDRALEAFRSAVKYSPQSFAPRLALGCALVEMKDHSGAAAQLNEALKLNVSSAPALLCMGRAQMGLQNVQFAEKAFVRAIEVSGGGLPKAHYYLGGIYWSERQYLKAADELEKYLKLEPNAKDADQTRKAILELRSKQN